MCSICWGTAQHSGWEMAALPQGKSMLLYKISQMAQLRIPMQNSSLSTVEQQPEAALRCCAGTIIMSIRSLGMRVCLFRGTCGTNCQVGGI